MKTIYYTVDLKNLLQVQETETLKNNLISHQQEKQRVENKTKLLKIVLPLIHGSIALHNNKCNNTTEYSTGKIGLLGTSKKNIEDVINFYVNDNYHFSPNCDTVEIELGIKKIKVRLNNFGKFVAAPHLEYSMTTCKKGGVYGSSIENELIILAKYCSRFKDNW